MTAEKLIQLKKVSAKSLTENKQQILFTTSQFDLKTNTSEKKYFILNLKNNTKDEVENFNSLYSKPTISPNGKYQLYHKEVQLNKIKSTDIYPDVPESDAKIYNQLNYRHWDKWEDGKYSHVFYRSAKSKIEGVDVMEGLPFDSPQKPFGGAEDYIWSP
ncbi:MAG TPA: hypothetical protein VJ970_01630, partial [Flavobacteriaceae bacterium]|nr:hypothetical protein [Flavobacteriaceae bacterium]